MKSLLLDRLADVRLPPYPVLTVDTPFGAISPYVAGLESLAQFGLVKVPDDASALSDFLQLSLVARLRELGVEDEIQVRPLVPFTAGFDDCYVLGVAVLFRARKTVDDGRPVVAVVVNTFLWQLMPESGLSKRCSDDKGPSLTNLEEPHVFLVEQGERERTLALTKDALLSIVDRAILRRLIETNTTVLQRVKSWVE